MSTIFTKIINQQIPSYKIKEDELFYAFLDIFPLQKGHTLVIPKIEKDNFFDLPELYLSKIITFAQPIAHAIQKSFPCNRCAMSVVGLEVPHAHIHLIPINQVADINFANPKLKLSPQDFTDIQQKIIAAL